LHPTGPQFIGTNLVADNPPKILDGFLFQGACKIEGIVDIKFYYEDGINLF